MAHNVLISPGGTKHRKPTEDRMDRGKQRISYLKACINCWQTKDYER